MALDLSKAPQKVPPKLAAWLNKTVDKGKALAGTRAGKAGGAIVRASKDPVYGSVVAALSGAAASPIRRKLIGQWLGIKKAKSQAIALGATGFGIQYIGSGAKMLSFKQAGILGDAVNQAGRAQVAVGAFLYTELSSDKGDSLGAYLEGSIPVKKAAAAASET